MAESVLVVSSSMLEVSAATGCYLDNALVGQKMHDWTMTTYLDILNAVSCVRNASDYSVGSGPRAMKFSCVSLWNSRGVKPYESSFLEWFAMCSLVVKGFLPIQSVSHVFSNMPVGFPHLSE